MFVDPGCCHALDRGQKLGNGDLVDTHGLGQGKGRVEVKPQDASLMIQPQLTRNSLGQEPDTRPFTGLRGVFFRRARFARGLAPAAVFPPAPEVPVSEAGKAFPSSPSTSAGLT